MVILQQTTMPRVVANRWTYLTLHATNAQWTDSGIMAVLQRRAKPRIVARPQANISPVARSTRPCRQNTLRLREMPTIHLKEERSGWYSRDLTKSGIADACEIDTCKRQRNHLKPWYTSLSPSPQGVHATTRWHCLYPRRHKLGAPPPWRCFSYHCQGCQ